MTWRNRILGLEEHKAGELLDHPLQFKSHPDRQGRVLRGIFDDIGIADALVAYKSKRAKGMLVKIDGHGRAGLDPDQPWPVLILDLTDDEADYLISLLDKSAELSVIDDDLYARALESIVAGDTSVSMLVDEILSELDVTDLIEETEDGEGESGANGSKRRRGTAGLIRVAITTDQAAIFEHALRGTGNKNRGDALIEICKEYMEMRGLE